MLFRSHTVAAAIALEKHDASAAEMHLAEAVRLEPDDKRHRLLLTAVRLESKSPAKRDAAIADLEAMRGNPATSTDALRQLLDDAIRRGEAADVRKFGEALIAEKTCNFHDKLAWLGTMRRFGSPRSSQYLLEQIGRAHV